MTWLRRADLEDQELHALSRFAALSSRSGGRRVAEHEDPLRTAFQRDRDRVIHSSAFRRMQHKTQVLAAYEGDHYRSRMTHSLEVSQMARSVARALRLNQDLAEVVALAHDIGHPPFGHVGEEALHELMHADGGFRHNAQGARIVDVLEDHYGHGCGLNLTLLTRRSLLKGKVPPGFPVSADLLPQPTPPLEARVVDLCDRIAYLSHDLDDGLRAGAFSLPDVQHLELWRRAAQRAASDHVRRVVSEVAALLIEDLLAACDRALEDAEREPPALQHGAEVARLSDECLAFLRDRFYKSPRVLDVMHAGGARIRRVFERFVRKPDDLPPLARVRLERDGLHRTVCDYISGMTDRFLLKQDE
jgi:dGTPase